MDKIVACIDGAGYTEAVCDYAAWAGMRLDVPLEFLHVLVKSMEARLDATGSIGLGAQEALLEELATLDARRSTLAREHGLQILEGARRRALSLGSTDVSIRQRNGEFVDTLLELESGTRLFVLGQHDGQAKATPMLLDHHLESAVRALSRAILVAAAPFTVPQRFLIAFDGSATGRKMVEMVASSPLLRGMACVVASVGGEEAGLSWAKTRLDAAGFTVSTHRLSGDPADVLLNYAEESRADMLVMGAYGHSRIRQWVVGSTTTAILRQAAIPVFILR